jgi:hypothetical protein
MEKVMGELLQQLRQDKSPKRKSDIEIALELLGPEDREDLIEAIKDITISAAAISRAVNARGIKLNPATITRYRRGEAVDVLGG